jgi:ferritin-like metal-binding protein YciE
MEEMREMLVEQLRDTFSAEKQAIQGMKRTLRKTSDADLKKGIEAHIAQSEEQRERVEQALETLDSRPGRKVCEAMRGLVEEAQHELEEHDRGPVLDLVIVAGQQRIEHYEIAAYGTMAELSKAIGEREVGGVLAEILAQEKAQDEKLTELTRSTLLPKVPARKQRARTRQRPRGRRPHARAAGIREEPNPIRERRPPAAEAFARGGEPPPASAVYLLMHQACCPWTRSGAPFYLV